VHSLEDALFAKDFADPDRGYAAYLDVDSVIDWYLVNEITKNQDAGNFSSIYFHKGAGDKLKMGPLWDFDLAAGNVNYSDAQWPEGWWVRRGSPWLTRLFQDPAFTARVTERFDRLANLAADEVAVTKFIDQTATDLEAVQTANFEIWPILKKYVWPNSVVTGSYAGEVAYLSAWLRTRYAWLRAELHAPPGARERTMPRTPANPFRHDPPK